MPNCDAEFTHNCDKEGYSQSSSHFNQWYCKTAYQIHLKTIDAVNRKFQDEYNNQMAKITGGKN